MKKVSLSFLLVLIFAATADAQTSRGLSLPASANEKPEGKTYALIVGISKYKNPAIPQLQYADRDAEAFRSYLVASGVDSNNIILRTNENARYADIMLDLDDICSNKVQAGDKVFIYFSGHGDVESHVITNDGYLLPYDAPKIVYAISAINVKILESYIATLSSKGVQAIVITDACHSGNLAGGLEGLKNIQTVLGSKWQDEIKILSCQPGELSLEGKQWGGGRGLFSYTLINGMAGMADKNNDGMVSLRELNLYLMDKVADGANPLPQNPMLSGNMAANISKTNKALMASLSSHTNDNMLAAVDVRGFETEMVGRLSKNIKSDYDNFFRCIDKGSLAQAIENKAPESAYAYYKLIPESDSLRILKAIMKRILTVRLSDEISERISYLTENKISKMNGPGLTYLGQALRELAGDKKLADLGILPKVLAFQACSFIVHTPPLFSEASMTLDTAIRMDSTAAYLYFLRGQARIMDDSMSQKNMYATDLRRCMDLSPRFVYSYFLMVTSFLVKKEPDSALYYLKKIPQVDSNIAFEVANAKIKAYYLTSRNDSVTYYSLIVDSLLLDSSDFVQSLYRHNMALTTYFEIGNYTKAIKYGMLFANPKFNGHFGRMHFRLAGAFAHLNQTKESIDFLGRAIVEDKIKFPKIKEDTDLDNIRSTPEFKALMKKYFPDQYKE